MQSLSEIRTLLADRGLRPKHRLGQNFLHDKNQIRRIVAAAEIAPGEVVLEVGSGTGTLTEGLVEAGAHVVCSEIDANLAAIVRDRLGDRVQVVEGDCLGAGRRLARDLLAALAGRPFVLVANLPYQVASPLMATLVLNHRECRGEIVTIQHEVAQRLAASPGTKAYGPLTIIIRTMAEVTLLGTLPPSCFWPSPKVTSAVVSIVPRPDPPIDRPEDYARWITGLFMKRRKQLGTILGRDGDWPEGITRELRPDALTVEQHVALWKGRGEGTEAPRH